jgi:hypothetical protein
MIYAIGHKEDIIGFKLFTGSVPLQLGKPCPGENKAVSNNIAVTHAVFNVFNTFMK